MKSKILRKLIDVEIRLGFLHIPAAGIDLFPEKNTKINALVDGESRQLTYNATHRRIFGLTKWYSDCHVKVGDEIEIEKAGEEYKLIFNAGKLAETPLKEAETLIDISGLSSQAKGNIVEERVKELILLQGQGLLSVYRPVTDTEGIDLIVLKSGMFQPLFLQIKGRFNVQKTGYFLMDISKKTFTVHHSYFVVGAYFNPREMEIDEHLLFVPSEEVVKAPIVKSNVGERYRIANHLNMDSKGRWAPHLIKKSDLASKLLEKFEEIGKYIK
ncbi:MAG TPA: hypothetical protein PL155_08525 [Candidatus Omnitrophota bacterium]|nr:hypothetical protein [Candidatus Omnitrophota bacterium]HPD85501.1 hypothetical protein [Candidatus Omnitrophota bacterium]HRZ03998.1 hypothetical protein [Candidatus Omnitrophota bacterium]